MRIRTKFIGTIVLGAALLAPVAQARPDDEAGPRGPGAIAAEETFVQGVTDFPSSGGIDIRQITGAPTSADGKVGLLPSTNARLVRHPDNRGGIHGPGAAVVTAAIVRPDDRAGARGPGAVGAPEVTVATHPDNRVERRGPGAFTSVTVQPVSDGFDWGDALIGGLGGAGMALLLTGSAFLLLSQRNRVRTA